MTDFSDDELSLMIAELLKRIEARQSENDNAHGNDHVRHVVANCRAIFEEVACKRSVVLFAACLHDIVSRKLSKSPGQSAGHSAEQAGQWLLPLGVPESIVQDVSDCIRTAAWEYQLRGRLLLTPEAYVLRDADLLESIGARGLARLFAFAGAHNLPLEWTDINTASIKELTPNVDQLEGPFRHFETKLLWVRNMMYSEMAKAEARKRHEFLLRFLEQYQSERTWSADF
jgi:uncharacterized protein